MIETITGNDFSASKHLSKRIDDYKSQYGDLSFYTFDGDDYDESSLMQAINSAPMLSEMSMIIVRGVSSRKDLHETIEGLSGVVPDYSDVIIFDPAIDKRTKLYKSLSANTEFKNFDELNEYQILQWILDEAERLSFKISKSEAQHLIERVGANQWQLESELHKLAGSGLKMDIATIDRLVEENPRNTIFELLDSTMRGDSANAVYLYKRLRKQQLEPGYILSMLIWQLNNMTIIKYAGSKTDPQIASEAKMSPFVIRKTRTLTNSMSVNQLNTMNKLVIDADTQTKTTSVEADLLVEQLITKLASSS